MNTEKLKKAPTLNLVDEQVKRLILNYFSIFPSRAHALEHMLLLTGTGYDWVLGNDGLYTLEGLSLEDEQSSRIEEKELDEESPLSRFADYNSGITLRNLMTNWISDNIDVYCTQRFKASSGVDLSPTSHFTHFMSGSAPLGNMPEASKIHPDWRKAIDEVISNQFDLIWAANLPQGSREALDYVRRHKPDVASLYLALMNAREKLESKEPVNAYKAVTATRRKELLTRLYADVVERANNAEWAAPSEEEFTVLYNEYKKSAAYIHESAVQYIVGRQQDRQRFFPEGRPNKAFEERAMAIIEGCTMFSSYPQASTLVYDIVRQLEVQSACESLVETYVNDTLPMLFTAS